MDPTPKSPFIQVDTPDPHRARARQIRRAHPEINTLNGRNPWTGLIALALAIAQLSAAAALTLTDAPWWLCLATAWLFGAFVCHALFVTIHEACHRLVFDAIPANRALMLLANLPMLIPFAIPLGHYHLIHHRAQGQLGRDPDLPSDLEVRWFTGSLPRKWAWHLLFPLLQLSRVATDARDTLSWRDPWLLLNLTTQLATLAIIATTLGPTALLYLAASLYFMFALHPLSGRFVQEHFVVEGQQETHSYYGPLGTISLNFGLHTEHHDFPAVPWHRLPEVTALAPESYDTRTRHTSWTLLWLKLLFDPTLQITHRVVRSELDAPSVSLGG